MPEYIYQHPNSQKIKIIVQSIHDIHEYTDEEGIKWNRIFTAPQLKTESSMNETTTAQQFSEYIGKTKGSVGDLWDRSAELSEKRTKIYGQDPVKKQYFKDWSKKRKGKKHPKDNS